MLFLYSFFAFKETYKWNQPRQVIASVFLILLYAFSNLLALSVIGYNLYVRWKGRESDKLSMICITLFAVICLVFGMKVSYSDFSSSSEPKMIICFLTMVLYVACLLVWKPYLSIILLGAIFYGFVLMLETWAGNREFFQGDRVNYITFYISLVMVAITLYQQRLKDATKAEALENKAVFDDLTSLHNYAHFQQEVAVFVSESNPQAGEYIYLYIDPDGFKSVNDTLGFAKGNEFLIELGQKIAGQFGDRLTARVSDDRFVAFAPVVDLEKKLAVLSDEVSAMGGELHTQLKVGGYLYRDPEESPRRAIDKARYACATVKHRNDRHYQEYDKKMHDSYHTLQYVTNHIDEAVANGWVRPYYQPVVFSSGRELCGVEALARWIDPKRGFLNPGQFIPVLEDTRLVHKLDTCIIETVCKDLRERLDAGLPCVPISINFSRLDFELMDAVQVLDDLVAKYNVPKDMLHVEVTESALSENVDLLSNAVKRLKEKGYAVWLDDFGSGYSSLNVLKDYEFDVLKLDMKFLDGFGSNDKIEPLIQAVIEMAGRIGLKTLCEGVETMEQADFLERAGCLRLQGWLYGKAIPKEELVAKIDSGEFKVRID